MKLIRTQAQIAQPPATVWSVLVDFDSYAQWNPLNVWAKGEARLGARVAMEFINPGRPGSTVRQKVVISDLQSERRLEWVGRVPLLFTGRHFFELAAEAGGTRLIHDERLSGLLPALWSARRMAAQRPPTNGSTKRWRGAPASWSGTRRDNPCQPAPPAHYEAEGATWAITSWSSMRAPAARGRCCSLRTASARRWPNIR